MGLRESEAIFHKLLKKTGNIDIADGLCEPIALIESIPQGCPKPSSFDLFTDSFLVYLQRNLLAHPGKRYPYLLNLIWGETKEDIECRSTKDPELVEILKYCKTNKHPITVVFPVDNGINHSAGSHFIRSLKGQAWEVYWGVKRDRPRMDLKTGKVIDDNLGFFTEESFFHPTSTLVIWPRLEK